MILIAATICVRQSRAGGKCDEVLRFVDSDARIVSVMRQYPCSPGRQGIGKQRRDDCPEIESVPCRADTPFAVVRTVMLRHNRRSKDAVIRKNAINVKNICDAGMDAATSSLESHARKTRLVIIIMVLLALRIISGHAMRQISTYPPGS